MTARHSRVAAALNGAALMLAAGLLTACVTPQAGPVSPSPAPSPVSPPVDGPVDDRVDDRDATPAADSPASLPGWTAEDHVAAFDAWLAGCGVARTAAAKVQCDRARLLQQTSRPVTPALARTFFETGFTLVAARTPDGGTGLMTAYFAPEYEARRSPDAEFDTPVLPKPRDLERRGTTVVQHRADGTTGPYADRAAIEAQAAATPGTYGPLAWMRAEDLFFLQIQGSGYLTFPDGGKARVAYAADNGRPFVGIARPMAERGLLPVNGTSGEAIRDWLASHRGAEARAVMGLNPRYIFFTLDADDGGHPAGAAGVPLPPRRAIAVDPAHWTYGELAWIDADAGNLPGGHNLYRGLVMALDTGSAIRGPVRADFYMGRGPAAGAEAGSVRHPLRMWRLVPKG
jgi:membrane-bound lytic murein transglycosylase A